MAKADIAPNYVMKAKCTRVLDGDTAILSVSPAFKMEYHELKFRFYGIDTPEKNAADKNERHLANLAHHHTRNAIEGKDILIRTMRMTSGDEKMDSFGRYLAVIYYKNAAGKQVNLNEELLKLGLAKEYVP